MISTVQGVVVGLKDFLVARLRVRSCNDTSFFFSGVNFDRSFRYWRLFERLFLLDRNVALDGVRSDFKALEDLLEAAALCLELIPRVISRA